MPLLDSALAIDPKREAERIEGDIRELVDTNSARGTVIGLSGGIDSAVLAALAVRAVGRERVYAYYLYDRDSSKESRGRAELMAAWLGIELEHHDITPAMREMKIYSPLIMKITALSGLVNRALDGNLHRFLWGESFFVSTLRRGGLNANRFKRFFYRRTIGSIEAAFNARHIYRRQFLERKSEEKKCLLLGAGNRSELMVGWFVKGGIDDVPFSPLVRLYKTQILQLAKCLELPAQIQNQTPSPDMLKGITDESAFGIGYDSLDIILDCIERDVSDEEIVSKGISKEDIRLVRTMNNLSGWKREPENPESSAV